MIGRRVLGGPGRCIGDGESAVIHTRTLDTRLEELTEVVQVHLTVPDAHDEVGPQPHDAEFTHFYVPLIQTAGGFLSLPRLSLSSTKNDYKSYFDVLNLS